MIRALDQAYAQVAPTAEAVPFDGGMAVDNWQLLPDEDAVSLWWTRACIGRPGH